MQNIDALKYPIGRFNPPPDNSITPLMIENWKKELNGFHNKLERLRTVITRKPELLKKPYRQDGRTVREILNHLAAYNTEAGYVVRNIILREQSYQPAQQFSESAFSAMKLIMETHTLKITNSVICAGNLQIVKYLRDILPEKLELQYVSKEFGTMPLKRAIALFVWHCEHHLAQMHLVVPKLPENERPSNDDDAPDFNFEDLRTRKFF